MAKKTTVLLSLLFSLGATAQQKSAIKSAKKAGQPAVINVPLTAENWEFKPNTVEFLTYKSVPAMKILNSDGGAILKQLDFKDGTIEYDMEPVDPRFTSFYFRWSNREENECFYFRTAEAGQDDAVNAVQYAPFIDGINFWDMLFHYQSNASFEREKWNHVKLVISGKKMRAYVNDNTHPVLEVGRLEGNSLHGGLAFDGQVIISNLVVKPGQTEGLSPLEDADITDNDPRYLRKWQISRLDTIPEKIDFHYDSYPSKTAAWDTIRAERRGLINITRKFGGAKTPVRRLVWLKTNIHSTAAQIRKLNLGFSDEVWIFLNGRHLYVDKNLFGSPIMKQPDGRCAVENTSFNLPLIKGDNELLIALANNFYGWGIIAQLDKNEDIVIEK